VRPDPVERARLRQRLRHVQLRSLEHALRDPERNPVDEEPLPQLERRGGRDVEAGEVGEVAAERLPPLCLRLRLGRAAPPEPAVEGCGGEHGGADQAADAERNRDNAVPARGDGVVGADPAEERQAAGDAEQGRRSEQRREPDVLEPLAALHLARDRRLEGGEVLRIGRPVVLDPVAEAGEPLRPVRHDRVDHLRHRGLEGLHRRLDVTEGELEVGDLL
jgi:hypothetical protein